MISFPSEVFLFRFCPSTRITLKIFIKLSKPTSLWGLCFRIFGILTAWKFVTYWNDGDPIPHPLQWILKPHMLGGIFISQVVSRILSILQNTSVLQATASCFFMCKKNGRLEFLSCCKPSCHQKFGRYKLKQNIKGQTSLQILCVQVFVWQIPGELLGRVAPWDRATPQKVAWARKQRPTRQQV